MEDFKTRLEAERVELQQKLQTLDRLLGTVASDNIDEVQKTLLIIQSKAMGTYLQCLESRIARL